MVGVDPADSGSGDSCGIIAASLTGEGVVAVIADVSASMTSDQWTRAAVDLTVDVGASEIAVEGFAARETYQRVVKMLYGAPGSTGPSVSPPGLRKARADAVASRLAPNVVDPPK